MTIRLYDIEDVPMHEDILWRLLLERSTEDDPHTNISHRKMPTYPEHLVHVERHRNYKWLLIYEDSGCAGSLSVTDRNEVGIVLFRAYRGKGIAKRALSLLVETIKPLPAVKGYRRGSFVANINPKNERSIALFESMGFEHVQNTYALREE